MSGWQLHLLVAALGGIIVVGTLKGLQTGLIRSAFRLAGILLGFLLARPLAALLAPLLEGVLRFPGARAVLVGVAFAGIAVAAALIGAMLAAAVKWTPLVVVDRLGGAACGLVLSVLVAGLILSFLDRLHRPDPGAAGGSWEHAFLDILRGLVPDLFAGFRPDTDLERLRQLPDSA